MGRTVLLTGPDAGIDRLSETANHTGPALWLFPSARAADTLRPRLAGTADAAHTFDSLAGDIIRRLDPSARPLSRCQQALLVAELLDAAHRDGKIDRFDRVADARGFAEAAVTLVDELRRGGTDPADLAAIADARGRPEDRQVADLYRRYCAALAHGNLVDFEGRCGHAAGLLRDGTPYPVPSTILANGFPAFTGPQRALLAALRDRGADLWLAVPGDPGRDDLAVLPSTVAAQFPDSEVVRLPGRDSDRPSALRHLACHLFHDRPTTVADAAGLKLIEAPGAVGEARMVARAVKRLLLAGTPPDDVIVTARRASDVADLFAEVFAEYGIPCDVEGTAPIARNPAVATLLRAARLPDEDWPFAGVTALLRSTLFRPTWPEAAADTPTQAEALLRLLGEPRHRESYLRATDLWADTPPPGLEDEQAEGPRRQRLHRLATECRPFLRRFFRAWDAAPRQATPTRHAAALRRLADDLGLSAADDLADAQAFALLWDELGRWASRADDRPLSRSRFHRLLGTLAHAAGLARTPRGPGRVRILSAEIAVTLPAEHLFVVGLGEKGFPSAEPASPLADETCRQALRQAGACDPGPADRLAAERCLFFRLVTRANRSLTLSYPAVDERGQALLPSPFLRDTLSLFAPDAVPVRRRRMLVEGYDRDEPLCPAEVRVRAALRMREADGREPAGLPAETATRLRSALALHRARQRGTAFNAFDGLLRDPEVLADLARRFGPERVHSPTALERYVACPFRFYLEQVLGLEPLEDPREEIEHTRRGAAVHRALSRLHAAFRDGPDHPDLPFPPPDTDAAMRLRLEEAVAEYAARAPSSAARVLWELEGRRLQRTAGRYREQWERFVGPWRDARAVPRPWRFEADFGLPVADDAETHGPLVVRDGDVEVRVGGRIDRVDLAEFAGGIGFWIVDYKTGRAEHYTASDLTGFRKLQLPLYALAVERVLLADRPSRPLGMAYWLVTQAGPKVVLPTGRSVTAWLAGPEGWEQFRGQLETWVADLVRHMRAGDFPLAPRSDHCTETCPFAQTCRITQSRGVGKTFDLPLPMLEAPPQARRAG